MPKGSSNEFTRQAYMLPDSDEKVLIHYLGDEKTAQDFPHGNQKKNTERKYYQQCPFSRKKTAEQVATTDPAKLYKTEIATMDCHPALAGVMKPKDIKQVRNVRHTVNQQRRISQDALYNMHEIAYDLPEFVWVIQTYPDLICVCGMKEVLDQLDRLL